MSNLPSSLLKLSTKERIYMQGRLDGLTQIAAGAAAGLNCDFTALENRPHYVAAMVAAMEDLAEETSFSRKEAHEMLMQAYTNAATAAEQIQAVKEMIALHGIAAAKKIEVTHEHKGAIQLERMETNELMKIAGMEHITLEGEYEVVTDDNGHDTKALPRV